MSYLSQIGMCLTAEAEMKLLEHVKWAQETLSSVDAKAISQFVNYPSISIDLDGVVLRYWSEYPWSESHTEIQFILKFLSDLEEANQADSFYLCRAGENPTDNEWLGGFYDNPFTLRLSRKVVFTSPILSNAPLPPIK